MSFNPILADAIAGLAVGQTVSAKPSHAAKLTVLHRETVETLPMKAKQEIRVLFARLEPGDTTPTHSHRFPVTLHVHEGEFTLDLDDRGIVTIGAGQVFVEPARVRMTGSNRGDTATSMTIFYVCEPDSVFADPA